MGFCVGYAKANVVILPKSLSDDFLLFCTRNPKACPLLEVGDVGFPHLSKIAPDADIRTDLPKYRVFRSGFEPTVVTDIESFWRDDLVTFALGCSDIFDQKLIEYGITVQYLEHNKIVPMYETSIPCQPSGVFKGPLVVSMRPIKGSDISRAVLLSARFPVAHGTPVHIGDPSAIGIEKLERVDYGDPPEMEPGDVPVFWACAVTPQAVALRSNPELMITHMPGHMLITDVPIQALSTL